MTRRALGACVCAALLGGCGGGKDETLLPLNRPGTLEVRSTAFQDGGAIPRRYTDDGDDVSPPLSWGGIPSGTKSFVLICDDPDAPTPQPWVHWVVFDIPADTVSVEEGATGGGTEGKNSWGGVGYRGPAPPPGHGVHHYRFTVYALDSLLGLQEGASKEDVLQAARGHVLAEGALIGTYKRRK